MKLFLVHGALIYPPPQFGIVAQATNVPEFIVDATDAEDAARKASRIVLAFMKIARARFRFTCVVRSIEGNATELRCTFCEPGKIVA